MYDWLKGLLLRALRVPPEPEPPRGTPGSLEVFRASENYYRYRRIVWLLVQALVVLSFLAAMAPTGFVALSHTDSTAQTVALLVEFLLFGVYLLQAVVSYLTIKLDYEMRWYMVTDGSLRIREGVWHVREMTMTFVNIQNLSISQGPVQRIFRIADLKVQTAGGGGAAPSAQAGHQQMHIGFFRGIADAERVRDLILPRLRQAKDAGLGEPDDVDARPRLAQRAADAKWSGAAIEALRTAHREAQALRQAAESL
jgi:uncharacterized membrane protein YdbT with pleckstrin-like domain